MLESFINWSSASLVLNVSVFLLFYYVLVIATFPSCSDPCFVEYQRAESYQHTATNAKRSWFLPTPSEATLHLMQCTVKWNKGTLTAATVINCFIACHDHSRVWYLYKSPTGVWQVKLLWHNSDRVQCILMAITATAGQMTFLWGNVNCFSYWLHLSSHSDIWNPHHLFSIHPFSAAYPCLRV